ncbi:hypothetical protein HBA54_19090 [Pelagibius litoralis]|uniref:Uncharacterized protein n=1 Tax=Pelagibius litoralis TaxID=374515 RepID=A0A967K8Y9_9PROT|nr:hypothetical protein [Pelagibius litoralis]NIA70708.1 hypothetical protein [Pelagibius litoralis]
MTKLFAASRKTGPASAWIYGEPRVDDLLGDPVVTSLLRRDGLTGADVRAAVALGKERLSPTTPKERQAA